MKPLRILAVNPWIYDFAAFDFWLKPYGFLVILECLKNKGAQVDFIDCLDKKVSKDSFGRGHYPCERVPKPLVLSSVQRHFKRYGKTPQEVEAVIKDKNPDYILLTSSMTYWYPGISQVLTLLQKYYPATPKVLGGTYATLCGRHARKTLGCRMVFENKDLVKFFKTLGFTVTKDEFYSTLPRYEDFYPTLDYVVLRTSWGCPFRCSFCAINKLERGFHKVGMEKIKEFLDTYWRRGIRDFVFYDDALLYQKDYIKTILRYVKERLSGIRFHTPNALHLRFLDEEIALLLKEAGFVNPHFGLETLDTELQKAWGDKVTLTEAVDGIELLKKAGFKAGEFSVYLLLGYPGQDLDRLQEQIRFLHTLGAKVSLAEFSITPSTKIFRDSRRDLSEPLLHNNSIFFSDPDHKLKDFYAIKNFVRTLNRSF